MEEDEMQTLKTQTQDVQEARQILKSFNCIAEKA